MKSYVGERGLLERKWLLYIAGEPGIAGSPGMAGSNGTDGQTGGTG